MSPLVLFVMLIVAIACLPLFTSFFIDFFAMRKARRTRLVAGPGGAAQFGIHDQSQKTADYAVSSRAGARGGVGVLGGDAPGEEQACNVNKNNQHPAASQHYEDSGNLNLRASARGRPDERWIVRTTRGGGRRGRLGGIRISDARLAPAPVSEW